VSEQDVSDAYIYLLGRLLVLRQERLDLREGFEWNRLTHRKPGEVSWPNPNLDVAYSEAWVAVDETSYLLVTVPEIVGRYFTVQFLNGWGETVANINERVFPAHPVGRFAVCLAGSSHELPADVQRIDVPVKYMRVLSRVELAAHWDTAIDLQHKFEFNSNGSPALPAIPEVPEFDLESLPGVEAFDVAAAALDSDADINEGMADVQARTRQIAEAVRDSADERSRVDGLIHAKAIPAFVAALPLVGRGTRQDGWSLPSTSGIYGDDWLTRTVVNYGGIWANTPEEVIYYKGFLDSSGQPLQSDNSYTLTFPADQLPDRYAHYFWSVIAVDAINRRVLPNPLNRYLLNNQSDLVYNPDGSLTLHFAPELPADTHDGNWLPTPPGQGYTLTFRFYGPRDDVASRNYFPPPLIKIN
jgi:hypothetical protein